MWVCRDVGRFFEEMPERNVVSWTALMLSYSLNGLPEEAVRAYQEMRQEGVVCNQNLFTTMISSCGLLENGKLRLGFLHMWWFMDTSMRFPLQILLSHYLGCWEE